MVQAQRGERGHERGNPLLDDIRRRVRLPAGVTAAEALRVVMCTLSQHVTGTEVHFVLEALPRSIRPVLERCADHTAVASSRFGRAELRRRVAEHLDVSPGDAEDLTSAVLTAIGAHVRPEELRDVARHLSLELRDLWVAQRLAPPSEPHPIVTAIETELALPPSENGAAAVTAFAVVTSALLRRLPRGEARHLVDRLPRELRPLVQPSVAHRHDDPHHDEPLLAREVLIGEVAQQLAVEDVEGAIRIVLRAVQEYLRAADRARVHAHLPTDLQEVWAEP